MHGKNEFRDDSGEAHPIANGVVHVDAPHEGNVALLVRLGRAALAICTWCPCATSRSSSPGCLLPTPAVATASAVPQIDVQREAVVEVAHSKLELVAETHEVHDLLCTYHRCCDADWEKW